MKLRFSPWVAHAALLLGASLPLASGEWESDGGKGAARSGKAWKLMSEVSA
jgi:hypothetical protein